MLFSTADLRACVAILLCARALAVLRDKRRAELSDLADACRLLDTWQHPAPRTVEKLDVRSLIG
jgi:hypothetical protein